MNLTVKNRHEGLHVVAPPGANQARECKGVYVTNYDQQVGLEAAEGGELPVGHRQPACPQVAPEEGGAVEGETAARHRLPWAQKGQLEPFIRVSGTHRRERF